METFAEMNAGIGVYLEHIFDLGDELAEEGNQLNTANDCMHFLITVHRLAQYSSACHIIAAVLMTRLVTSDQSFAPANKQNWRPLLFVCILIAQKLNDDVPLQNSGFMELWNRCEQQACAKDPNREPPDEDFPHRIDSTEVDIMMRVGWHVAVGQEVFDEFTDELCGLGKQALHAASYEEE